MNNEITNTVQERKYTSVGKRFFSHLIDSFMNGLVVFSVLFIVEVIINVFKIYNAGQGAVLAEPTTIEKIFSNIRIILPMIAIVGGQPLSMIFMKQTIGMKIFNFKIVNENGSDISMNTRIIRNVIWVLLLISGVGTTADFIVLYVSKKHQSVIDLIMNNIALDN